MEDLLRQLLNQLEDIGDTNKEVFDTECRDKMASGVFDGFLRPVAYYVLPGSFGLYTTDANQKVREALASYINEASRRAASLGIVTFKQRLNAFQNGAIKSDRVGLYYDDFFGYMQPDDFDETGKVV
jgi:hypothetical protein